MKNFKLAFVGCGKVANHYKNLIKQNPIKNLEISGVCDSNLETAKIFSEKFSKKYFNDLDKMLSGIEIDLAIVCSPSGMHYEQSKKIIENGNNLIPPHRDSVDSFGLYPTISLVSIGQKRNLVIERTLKDQLKRDKNNQKLNRTFQLNDNSMFIMAGCSQRYWCHSIEKDDSTKKRYSFSIREYL